MMRCPLSVLCTFPPLSFRSIPPPDRGARLFFFARLARARFSAPTRPLARRRTPRRTPCREPSWRPSWSFLSSLHLHVPPPTSTRKRERGGLVSSYRLLQPFRLRSIVLCFPHRHLLPFPGSPLFSVCGFFRSLFVRPQRVFLFFSSLFRVSFFSLCPCLPNPWCAPPPPSPRSFRASRRRLRTSIAFCSRPLDRAPKPNPSDPLPPANAPPSTPPRHQYGRLSATRQAPRFFRSSTARQDRGRASALRAPAPLPATGAARSTWTLEFCRHLPPALPTPTSRHHPPLEPRTLASRHHPPLAPRPFALVIFSAFSLSSSRQTPARSARRPFVASVRNSHHIPPLLPFAFFFLLLSLFLSFFFPLARSLIPPFASLEAPR